MLVLAVTLAERNPVYDDMVVKFLEQFVLIMRRARGVRPVRRRTTASSTTGSSTPPGTVTPIKVQTLVGMIPALPAVVAAVAESERLQRLRKRFARRLEQRAGELAVVAGPRRRATSRRLLVSVVSPDQLRRVLATLFDEDAFLSPHGLRSLSKRHDDAVRRCPACPARVIDYEPAESRTAMYGGNSNWRGPVWFPVNYLAIRALLQYDQFFGADFTVEYPTGSGKQLTLREIAGDLADRLVGIWLPDADGRRPVYGGVDLLQTRPGVEGQPAVLRVLPRRRRRRPRRRPPDRLDRARRRPHPRPARHVHARQAGSVDGDVDGVGRRRRR